MEILTAQYSITVIDLLNSKIFVSPIMITFSDQGHFSRDLKWLHATTSHHYIFQDGTVFYLTFAMLQ